MISSLSLVWKSAFPACVQALRSGHHLWGDVHVHKPAAGAAVRVGPHETARKWRCFWCPGEVIINYWDSSDIFRVVEWLCSCCCYKRGLWTAVFVRVKMASVLKSKLCLQVEGCFPDTMTRCAELINNNTDVDFVDINSGCPIDLVYKKVNPPIKSSSAIQIKIKFHCGFHFIFILPAV